MRCLPKLSFLINHIHKMNINARKNLNNISFYKILIDIYGDYLSNYDSPLFKVIIIPVIKLYKTYNNYLNTFSNIQLVFLT